MIDVSAPRFYHCNPNPLQAVNWCHKSRFVIDEDNLKWVANGKKKCYCKKLQKNIFVLKPLGFRKLSPSSEMQNDAFMHKKGLNPNFSRPVDKHFQVCFKSN